MKDRFVAGAVSGFLGAAVQITYGYITCDLGLTDRSFHDFGKVFIMSSPDKGIFSDFVGIISSLSNGVILGIIFAYLIYFTSSKFYLIIGAIYGIAFWHFFLGLGTMFRMPAFGVIPAGESFATLIGSIIYGLITAYMIKILDEKTTL